MTEAEWLACADPRAMLAFIRGRASDRKFRLFACACCRTVGAHLPGEGHRLLAGNEALADGGLSGRQLRDLRVAARTPTSTTQDLQGQWGRATAAGMRAVLASAWAIRNTEPAGACERVVTSSLEARRHSTWHRADREFADFIRDVFGNPFRPAAVEPGWSTPTVVALAQGVYADRAFDRLPILADALQDAGCDNDDILTHLRDPGPHVRGCWVVDLLTGRE